MFWGEKVVLNRGNIQHLDYQSGYIYSAISIAQIIYEYINFTTHMNISLVILDINFNAL